MGKQIKIKKRNQKRQKLDTMDWFHWTIATIGLVFFIGIVSGTSSYYLGSQQPIGLGLYMDWQLGAYILGFAIWGIISYFILKE